ncbi:hypothetical protein Vafri_10373 [Volvox africanus]|uniref:Uncharacterized protein n=1 Tax=Volvox africanus TaxID=51714 RepID=A0A8J4B6I3_9CHLO|nr:hypothetical protein Vafri_10373 [Volvox africanus]
MLLQYRTARHKPRVCSRDSHHAETRYNNVPLPIPPPLATWHRPSFTSKFRRRFAEALFKDRGSKSAAEKHFAAAASVDGLQAVHQKDNNELHTVAVVRNEHTVRTCV